MRKARAILIAAAENAVASRALAILRQRAPEAHITAVVRADASLPADECIAAAARGRYGFALTPSLLRRLRGADIAWAVVGSLDDSGYRRVAALLHLAKAKDKQVLGPEGEPIPFAAWLGRAGISVGPGAMMRAGLSALGAPLRRRRARRLLRGARPPWGFRRVNIGITDRCNHRCLMCSEHSPYCADGARRMAPEEVLSERDFGLMEAQVYHQLIRDLAHLGTREVELCGLGEPLLHPHALAFLREAKEAGLWVRLVTNASLLDEQRARELVGLGLDELHVSINAGKAETYGQVHGVPAGGFARAVSAIEAVAAARREAGAARPLLEASFVVQALNYREPRLWAETMARAGADLLTFSALGAAPPQAPVTLAPDQLETAKANVAQARAWARGRGLAVRGTFAALAESGPSFTAPLYADMPCYIGYIFALVTATGRLHPCCACERVVGELREGGFAAAWRGESYRRFREEALDLPQRLPALEGCSCTACPYGPWNLEFHRRLHRL